jgi:hypothetical protein
MVGEASDCGALDQMLPPMPSWVAACTAFNVTTAPRTENIKVQPDFSESLFMAFLLRMISSLDLKHRLPTLGKPPRSRND